MSTVKDAKTMSPKALLRKRNSWRDHECNGCRSNIYNWPESSGRDERDLTACGHKLDDEHVCWSLEGARRVRYRPGRKFGTHVKLRSPAASCHLGGLHGGRR